MAKNDYNLADYYKILEKDLSDEDIVKYFAMQSLDLVGWKDHIAELADVKAEVDVGKDSEGNPLYQHKRYDGVIFQEGTPVNAENLGKMEWNDIINALKIMQLEEDNKKTRVEVATLKGQNNNNMPYNSFVANARNSSEIRVIEGWYDEVNGRVVV